MWRCKGPQERGIGLVAAPRSSVAKGGDGAVSIRPALPRVGMHDWRCHAPVFVSPALLASKNNDGGAAMFPRLSRLPLLSVLLTLVLVATTLGRSLSERSAVAHAVRIERQMREPPLLTLTVNGKKSTSVDQYL